MTQSLPADIRARWQVPAYELHFWLGRRKRWCVVIPVINEGARIRRLLSRMSAMDIAAIADVLIVDGGSNDGSLDHTRLRKQGVQGLLLKTGFGQLSSQLRCGYAFALDTGYDGIVTIDGNDKDDPEAIPRFIESMINGFDFVQASRFVRGGIGDNTPRIRELAIRWVHAPLLSVASGFPWTDTTQGFRAYSRRMLVDPNVALFRDIFVAYELLPYLSYRAPRLGYRCLELPTIRRYPEGSVPTKIGGLRGNLGLLLALLRSCLGAYDP